MRHLRMFVFVMTLCACKGAEGQTFNRRYDALGQHRTDEGASLERDGNGGYVVFAGARYFNAADSLLYAAVITTLHVDAQGTAQDTSFLFISQKATYLGWSNTSFRTSNDGFGTGSSTLAAMNTHRPMLVLYDSVGSIISSTEYNIYAIGRQGKATLEKGCILVGESASSGTSNDAILIKTDSLGVMEWWSLYGLPNRQEYAVSVALAPHGGYYIGGQQESSTTGSYDQWVVRTDSVGNVLWSSTYGGPFNDIYNANIELLSDGNLACASAWAVNANDVQLLGMMKLDTAGGVLWSKRYDVPMYGSTLLAVKEISGSGDLIATGFGLRNNNYQGALLRTDAQGDSLWMRYYFYYDSVWTEGQGVLRDVLPTDDGGFIAVGSAYNSNNPNDPPIYSQDTWVVKVDSMGCIVPGCHLITEVEGIVTNLRDVLRVWPNPVVGGGKISLEMALPEGFTVQGALRLTVTNPLGQLVQELRVPDTEAPFSFTLAASAPGLYHVHLSDATRWISGTSVVVE